MISLPRPKISTTDKRLTFTALGAQGFVPFNAGEGNMGVGGQVLFFTSQAISLLFIFQQLHGMGGMMYTDPSMASSSNHMNMHEPAPTNDGGYYARSWGTHPDIRAFDLRSQASSTVASEHQGQYAQVGKPKAGGDSRFDSKYDVVSQDGSINTQ